MAIGDLAITAEHVGLGHPVDAEIDRDMAGAVDADAGIGIAVTAKIAPRRSLIVLVVDAVEPDRLILGESHEQRMLDLTFDAPRGKHIDDGRLALRKGGGREAQYFLPAVGGQALQRRKRELRHWLADQRRGKPRRIAALERVPEQASDRSEDDERKCEAEAPSQVWLTGHVGHEPRCLPVLALG